MNLDLLEARLRLADALAEAVDALELDYMAEVEPTYPDTIAGLVPLGYETVNRVLEALAAYREKPRTDFVAEKLAEVQAQVRQYFDEQEARQSPGG